MRPLWGACASRTIRFAFFGHRAMLRPFNPLLSTYALPD